MSSTTPTPASSRILRRLLVPPLALAALAGCRQPVAEPVAAESVTWVDYTNDDLAFTLSHPASWSPQRKGNSVLFQDPRLTPMRVTFAAADEARRRGLWGRGEPAAETTLGRLTGRLYRYDHYDGPFYVPTLAWVVEHRDRELGVEFRTPNADLDPVQRSILESLRLN